HSTTGKFGCCATRPKLLRNFWDSNSARKAGQALLAESPEFSCGAKHGLTDPGYPLTADFPSSAKKQLCLMGKREFQISEGHSEVLRAGGGPRISQAMFSGANQFGAFCEDCSSPNFFCEAKKWSSSAAAELVCGAMADSGAPTRPQHRFQTPKPKKTDSKAGFFQSKNHPTAWLPTPAGR
ncbi:MAG: hypothetical protein V2I26_16710, partial [Halieaceae bacterium]|nr:hypothetical protein [Halieaceae bacterium]